MHHFTHKKKIGLYSRIYSSLMPGGKYIECDYMVVDQADEEFFFAEYERIRREQNISEDEFYHYDRPCTISNQIRMLQLAKFDKVEMVWREDNTTIIEATKNG